MSCPESFFCAYLACALWVGVLDSKHEPIEDNRFSVDDIAPDALKEMRADCNTFYDANQSDLTTRSDEAGGHDLWLTRNRHGVGYWETPDWPEDAGRRLTEAAHRLGGCFLYKDEDGKLHLESG